MEVKKTVQAGIVNLTNIKEKQLSSMWDNYQRWLDNEYVDNLYSAHKQQARRNLDKVKEEKEYPIFLRKDLIDIEECESDIADYFFKIPSKQRYGGLKVPIRTHIDIEEGYEVCESQLIKKDDRFYLNIFQENRIFLISMENLCFPVDNDQKRSRAEG